MIKFKRNNNNQMPNKIQNNKFKKICLNNWFLIIGIYLKFGISNLVFEISDLEVDAWNLEFNHILTK